MQILERGLDLIHLYNHCAKHNACQGQALINVCWMHEVESAVTHDVSHRALKHWPHSSERLWMCGARYRELYTISIFNPDTLCFYYFMSVVYNVLYFYLERL